MRWLAEQPDCEEDPQITCEFWIYNFQFEIFYDLSKHHKKGEIGEVCDSLALEVETLEFEEEKGGGRPTIDDLPTEMLSRIFSFFTAVDLLVVREVCRRWRDIIQTDKGLWNHIYFSAADFDVKTTASLLKEMPLLRTINLCNVHSAEDMTLLTSALNESCWELRQVHFPDSCDWHPSAKDLHQLSYFHPRITSLELCTKQKLTPTEISNLGIVLSGFSFLTRLKLVGFYWHQPELIQEVLEKIQHLSSLILPSLPGLTGTELNKLKFVQPQLKSLTINTSSLSSLYLNHTTLPNLKELNIIDSSAITAEKLTALTKIAALTSLDINLSSSKKDSMMGFFTLPHLTLKELRVSNCEFSNDLLTCLPQSCFNLLNLVWLNPKDVLGEVTDIGILAISRLPQLQCLEIKSRSVSKAHYPDLAAMRTLKYARINGMRVPGCL